MPKADFEKLKKRADNFAEKEKVEDIVDYVKGLDRGMGVYATS